ncbi:MAG TPA: hypothetical protein VNO55_19715 [Polyangia bacterium]|jgi:hypothetical protein|nr:hypothetical protein [Polyangia bacterium]
MAVRPVSYAPAPFAVPAGGTIEDRFNAIAIELNRKANAGTAGPAFRFIGMISPNGTTWRLSVDDAGVVHTEVVPR